MNRRRFLRTGLIGGALLAAGGVWVAWRDLHHADQGPVARDRVGIIVAAVAPVLLSDAWPIALAEQRQALARVVEGVKNLIARFPPAIQRELADLFGVLDLPLARRTLTGVRDDWPHAEPREVAMFLDRWRTSRIALLQSGYFALHDLVTGVWYADPSTWLAIGYPGPPQVN